MWENPLSLWIKETVCIMFTGGEGGTQEIRQGERGRGSKLGRKTKVGKVSRKTDESYWIEVLIQKNNTFLNLIFLSSLNNHLCSGIVCFCTNIYF